MYISLYWMSHVSLFSRISLFPSQYQCSFKYWQ